MSAIPTYEDIARFHGHTCPGLALGYRVALAALGALGADRALDEELVAVVDNDSCAVDAIQVVLGCTFGKGNLIHRDYGKHVYTIYRRDHGSGVRISLALEEEPREMSREQRECLILTAPQDALLCVEPAEGPVPERAQTEPSEPCDACGQLTMCSRLVEVEGSLLCRPCAERATTSSGNPRR